MAFKDQLLLPLSVDKKQACPTFLKGVHNQAAWAWVKRWPDWPKRGLVVTSPGGSGAGYLGDLWRQTAGAFCMLPPTDVLSESAVPQVHENLSRVFGTDAKPALWCPDFHRWLLGAQNQRLLLALYNAVQERGGSILLTGRLPNYSDVLPDLSSRLKALPVASVGIPDDGFFKEFLAHLFKQKQMAAPANVITFLLHRLPRKMGFAASVVERLAKESLKQKKAISFAFLKQHEHVWQDEILGAPKDASLSTVG